MENYLEMKFLSIPENVSFSRSTVSAFCLALDPSVEELNDVKTAVSEAVTNSIVHGYENRKTEIIEITAKCEKNSVEILIVDHGVGIPDVKRAMEPFSRQTQRGKKRHGFHNYANVYGRSCG